MYFLLQPLVLKTPGPPIVSFHFPLITGAMWEMLSKSSVWHPRILMSSVCIALYSLQSILTFIIYLISSYNIWVVIISFSWVRSGRVEWKLREA